MRIIDNSISTISWYILSCYNYSLWIYLKCFYYARSLGFHSSYNIIRNESLWWTNRFVLPRKEIIVVLNLKLVYLTFSSVNKCVISMIIWCLPTAINGNLTVLCHDSIVLRIKYIEQRISIIHSIIDIIVVVFLKWMNGRMIYVVKLN